MDHYTYTYPVTLSRRMLRSFLLKRNQTFSMNFCRFVVVSLWSLHRLVFGLRNLPRMHSIRNTFLRMSPVVDYQILGDDITVLRSSSTTPFRPARAAAKRPAQRCQAVNAP